MHVFLKTIELETTWGLAIPRKMIRNLLQERLTILPSHTGNGESGKLLKILTISMFDGDLRPMGRMRRVHNG